MALRVGPRGLLSNIGLAYMGLRRSHGRHDPVVGLAFGEVEDVFSFFRDWVDFP